MGPEDLGESTVCDIEKASHQFSEIQKGNELHDFSHHGKFLFNNYFTELIGCMND
jgi:hypothetical protein